jgi:hypothetical protein
MGVWYNFGQGPHALQSFQRQGFRESMGRMEHEHNADAQASRVAVMPGKAKRKP